MSDTKITVQRNGPLRLEGEGLQIVDPTGAAYGLGGRTVVSLCRCGMSNNKTVCDRNHNHHTFPDEPAARGLPPQPTTPPGSGASRWRGSCRRRRCRPARPEPHPCPLSHRPPTVRERGTL